MSDTPFGSLEAAHEYLGLLLEAVQKARADVDADLAALSAEGETKRHHEALHLVSWKLERLETHLSAGRRTVHDLQRLRRLLLGDAEPAVRPSPPSEPDDDEP